MLAEFTADRSRAETDRPPVIWLTVACLLAASIVVLCVILVGNPELGLTLTWSVAAPALPLVFLIAPTVWRNVCPLALVNQLPRLGGFSRGLEAPQLITRHGFTIAATSFVGLVALRPVLLDHHGPATAVVIAGGLVLAFVGGLFVRGKAGWCGTVCPLFAPQRIYGRAPLVRVEHGHCRPCVGCLRSCSDLNPGGVSALENSRRPEALNRRLLLGAAPGLVIGYFVGPSLLPSPAPATMLAVIAPAALTGLAYLGLETFVRRDSDRHRRAVNNAFGAAAFGFFYFFALPQVLEVAGWDHPDAVTAARLLALVGALSWWVHDYRVPRATEPDRTPVTRDATAEVTFHGADGRRRSVTTDRGETLATAARLCGSPVSLGCGVGACGADPVTVLSGANQLTEPTVRERATLRRIGASADARLACVARVTGPVSVNTRPPAPPPPGGIDLTLGSVVIIGTGIAGLTAAESIRRLHPTCAIHLVGKEPHHPYNRMALTDLVTGGTELSDLGVLPSGWAALHRVSTHVGVVATEVDPDAGTVALDSGEEVGFDRLILATGAEPIRPSVRGLPMPGAFTLRTAEEAMAVREYAESRADLRHAVVVGAGALGIEVAAGLTEMGFEVCAVDRDPRPAAALLDDRAGELVRDELGSLGVEVRTGVTVRWVLGPRRVSAVRLSDGQRIPCDLLLLCAGTRPDVTLARQLGLATRRGILVDDALRTSQPQIFAIGDAAEHESGVSGLWQPAMEQAEIVAEQVVAGVPALARPYHPRPVITRLAVPGLDVVSIGRIRPEPLDHAMVAYDDIRARRYLKLVVSADGQVVGGIVVGDPDAAARVESAVASGIDVRPQLGNLRAGVVTALA